MAPVIARYLPDFSVPQAAPSPRSQDGLALLLRNPVKSAPAPVPAEDREALLRAAEAKGWEQGRADAQAESAAILARARADFDTRLDAIRQDWCHAQADVLAAGFGAAIASLAGTLSERIGPLLVPVLTESLRRQAVEDLSAILSRLLAGGSQGAPIQVKGPADLIDAIAGRLGPLGGSVAFTPADTIEVAVQADETLIETQLGAWSHLLAKAVGER